MCFIGDEIVNDSHKKGNRPRSAMRMLLTFLKTESNAYNLQLLLWSLPTLPTHSPHWSIDDSDMRAELIGCALNCLKEHIDVNVLTTCVKSLGFVASAQSNTDHSIGCDILLAICDFIRMLLTQISGGVVDGVSSSSQALQQLPNAMAPTPTATASTSTRSQAARRVQNIYKSSHKSSTNVPLGLPLTNAEKTHLADLSFHTILEWLSLLISSSFLQSNGWVLREVHDTAVYFVAVMSKHNVLPGPSLNYRVFSVLDFLLVRCGCFPENNPRHCTSYLESSVCPNHSVVNGCWACGIPSLRNSRDCYCSQLEETTAHYIIDGDTILSVVESVRSDAMKDRDMNCGSDDTTALIIFVRSKHGKRVFESSSLVCTGSGGGATPLDVSAADQMHAETVCDMSVQPTLDGLYAAFSECSAKSNLLLPMQLMDSADSSGSAPPPLVYTGSHMSSMLSIASIESTLASSLQLSDPLCTPFLARLSKQQDAEEHSTKSAVALSQSPSTFPFEFGASRSIKLFVKARQMLTQFGFAGFHSHGQVMELENSPSLREKLSALDDVQCREQCDAWCVFATNISGDNGECIVAPSTPASEDNTQYSPHYIQFLLGLGWLADVDYHQGKLKHSAL
jgi:hypothetical protein